MALKLTISFKNTEEEKDLYKWITDHSNYSGFVKDVLKEKKKGEIKKQEEKINLIDF